jgi:nucleotide-binding universal stress UspA family protein
LINVLTTVWLQQYVCVRFTTYKTAMTNEILCTIDFTESSKEALKLSLKMARELQAKLTILFTYRLIKYNGEAVAMKKEIERTAAEKFEVLEKELLKDAGVDYEFTTEVGFVDDRIEHHAREHKIGFLVMGQSMRTKTRDTFNGLVSQLQIPLVIVP